MSRVSWVLLHAALVCLCLSALFAHRSNSLPAIDHADRATAPAATKDEADPGAACLTFHLPSSLVWSRTNTIICSVKNPNAIFMAHGPILEQYELYVELRGAGDAPVRCKAEPIVSFYHYINEAAETVFPLHFQVPPGRTPASGEMQTQLVRRADGKVVRETVTSVQFVPPERSLLGRMASGQLQYWLYAHMGWIWLLTMGAYGTTTWLAAWLRGAPLVEFLRVRLWVPAVGFFGCAVVAYLYYYRLVPAAFTLASGVAILTSLPLLMLCWPTSLRTTETEAASEGGTRPLVIALLVAATGVLLCVQIKNLQLFEWDYFCERDYARALLAVDGIRLEMAGPQLLSGGRLPGFMVSALYYLPLKLWRDPMALAILCRLLYFGATGLIYFLLAPWYGRPLAACATLLAALNVCLYGFSVWPIHPSFTPLFGLLFMWALLWWTVNQRPAGLIWCSVLYSVLIQLHMSYVLLGLVAFLAWALLRPRTPLRAWIWAAIVSGLFVMPYFVDEIGTGFFNTREIVSRPRFQPDFVAKEGIINMFIATRMLFSVVAYDGVGASHWQELFWMALVPLGMLRFAWLARSEDRGRAGCAQVVLCYYAGTALFYSFYGSWLENRYFLVLFPVLFLCQAAGLEVLAQGASVVLRRRAVASGVVVSASLWLGWMRVPQLLAYAEPGHRYVGDWTAPYEESHQIARTLIAKYGVDPEVWREQVYLFWRWPFVGPDSFERWYQAETKKGGTRPAKGTGYIVLCDGCPLPDFLSQNPRILVDEQVKEPLFTLIRYHTPNGATYSNTNNPNVHSEPEREVERFARLETDCHIEPAGDGVRAFYRLPVGRIIAMQFIKVKRLDNGDWDIDSGLESPWLSGYYQEIKSVYQPFVEACAPDGAVVFRGVITEEVLGGNLVKTPLRRTFRASRLPENATFRIGVQTWYDRSTMESPRYERFSLPVARLQDGRLVPMEKP
jgi:hypothetical protein